METLEISTQKPAVEQKMLRGFETEDQLQDKINWESINDYMVENENGSSLSFKDVYHDATTIVIFIRHFLCFAAKEYVEDLAKIPRKLLEESRIRLVIIGCGENKFMKQFRRDTGYWAEFYTDPKRELFSMMGCKNSVDIGNLTASKHIKSAYVTGVLRSAVRSTNFPGELQGEASQQGGSFILGPGERCQFAHVDQNSSNHYPINKLLDLVGVDNVRFAKDSGIITV